MTVDEADGDLVAYQLDAVEREHCSRALFDALGIFGYEHKNAWVNLLLRERQAARAEGKRAERQLWQAVLEIGTPQKAAELWVYEVNAARAEGYDEGYADGGAEGYTACCDFEHERDSLQRQLKDMTERAAEAVLKTKISSGGQADDR